jgi:hypothetical protein
MALKPDRVEHLTDIGYFKSDAVIERGLIVAHSTGGSGAAMDDAAALVANVSKYSDAPAGLILNDVVNVDLTRQQYNAHKDEMQLGGKVTLLRRGTVVTDQISGTPAAGSGAYFGLDGKLFSEDEVPAGATGAVGPDGRRSVLVAKVGTFLGVADADGFAKVEINIV